MGAPELALRFEPVDLATGLPLAVRFWHDAFACSFAGDRVFDEAEYLSWLKPRLARDPWLAVHVHRGGQIIGQMEFSTYAAQPWIGYVHLYYLTPEQRGLGLGTQLDDYAAEFLRKRGFASAHLTVSPKNARALRFYTRHGWVDGGEQPGNVRRMEKELVPPVIRVATLETERLWLRSVSALDIPACERHFIDYEVVRFLSRRVPWPYPPQGVAEHFAHLAAQPPGSHFRWGIFRKEAPLECVGTVDLFQPGIPHNRGFWLGRAFWGRGYMSEATAAINDHAFEQLGFSELRLANAQGNERSRRIKEKSGARFLGLEPAEYVDPAFTQQELWSLSKDAWRQQRTRSP